MERAKSAWIPFAVRALEAGADGVFGMAALGMVWLASKQGPTDGYASVILCVGGWVAGLAFGQAACFAFALVFIPLMGLQRIEILDVGGSLLMLAVAIAAGTMTARCWRPEEPGRAGVPSWVRGLSAGMLLCVAASFIGRFVTHSASWAEARGAGFGAFSLPMGAALVLLAGLGFFRAAMGGLGELMPSFAVSVSAAFAFNLFEHLTQIPESSSTGDAFCSPFEDIHLMGTVCVTTFAYALPRGLLDRGRLRAAGLAVAALALALTVYSFSRSAWLAGLVVVALVVAFLLRGRTLAIAGGAALAALVCLEVAASRFPGDPHTTYWGRFASLVRMEAVGNKDPGRVHLYGKAWRMIEARPLAGFGVGSFYSTSPRFAQASDPLGSTPNFAHDVFLQLGAELGAPFALAFAAVVVGSIAAAYRRRNMAIACALLAFVLTQLTSNSFNIYQTAQLLFWILVAGCFSPTDRRAVLAPC